MVIKMANENYDVPTIDIDSNSQYIDRSAMLVEFTYLDSQNTSYIGQSLSDILNTMDTSSFDENQWVTYYTLQEAVAADPGFGDLVVRDMSCSDNIPTGDYLEAMLFQDPNATGSDTFYMACRGTGNGRWIDNARMLNGTSVIELAQMRYMEHCITEYNISLDDNFIISAHSKEGGGISYANAFSEYNDYIDLCVSLDGLGLSEDEWERFNQLSPEERLAIQSRTILIAGENDFVNTLGYQLATENNTYYIHQIRNSTAMDYHMLDALVTNRVLDEHGNPVGSISYSGITNQFYRDENGNYISGPRGPVGDLSADIYAWMLTLDPERRDALSRAVMSFLDINREAIGDNGLRASDYIYLVAELGPMIIDVICTEDGLAAISQIWEDTIIKTLADDYLKDVEEHGEFLADLFLAGKAILVVVAGIALTCFFEVVVALGLVFKLLDWLGFLDEFAALVDALVAGIQRFIDWVRDVSPGGYYASQVPHIVIDPERYYALARDLRSVKSRISECHRRIKNLYWSILDITDEDKIDVTGLFPLIGADFLSQFTICLDGSISYLEDTATAFENADSAIANIFRGY